LGKEKRRRGGGEKKKKVTEMVETLERGCPGFFCLSTGTILHIFTGEKRGGKGGGGGKGGKKKKRKQW